MCGHIAKTENLVDAFVRVCARAHTHRAWQLCLVSLATPVECCQGCNERVQSDRQTDKELAVGQDYKTINNLGCMCMYVCVCVCTRSTSCQAGALIIVLSAQSQVRMNGNRTERLRFLHFSETFHPITPGQIKVSRRTKKNLILFT